MAVPQTTPGIDTSVPESWYPAILAPFEAQTVFANTGIVNRNYEGIIKQQGDTVHVARLNDIAVKKYDASEPLVVDDLETTDTALAIDQGDYFAFKVNDVDEFQSAVTLKDPALMRAGKKLAAGVDKFLAETMSTGVLSGNKLGSVEVAKRGDAAYDLIVELRKKLAANDAPDNRFLIVGPEMESALLRDDRLVKVDASGTDTALRNGLIGRILGFNVYVSNNVKVVAGRETVLAGVPEATTFADQLSKMRQLPMQNFIATQVDGVHIYGGKVFQPEGLASAEITLTDGATTEPAA